MHCICVSIYTGLLRTDQNCADLATMVTDIIYPKENGMLNNTLTVKQYNLSLVMRKPAFCICENKDADQLRAFVFATRIVQPLYFLNPKFQVSSHLLWLYSPVCVGPGRKPRRPVFSERGSIIFSIENVNEDKNAKINSRENKLVVYY